MKSNEINYYIFIANDITLNDDQTVSVEVIFDALLTKGFWAFTESAPLHSKLKPGDYVVFYAAGRKRHHFSAHARIKECSKKISDGSIEKNVLSGLGINFMRHSVVLREIEYLNPPVSIVDLKPKLIFIKDKKNYGLHLRLPVVNISSRDYKRIIGKVTSATIGG